MTLWAIQAAPLIMGHDLRQTSASALRLLKNRDVIAIDQDARGVQGRMVREEGALEIWRKELADGSVALAPFNRGEVAAQMTPTAADAHLARLTRVRDLGPAAPGATAAFPFPLPAPAAGLPQV